MENKEVNNSRYVYSSRSVDSSRCVYSSRYVYLSRSVDSSRYVYSSRSVDSSRYVCFCHDIKLGEYRLWNKQADENRYYVVRDKIRELLANKEKPDFVNLDWDTAWEKSWKSVSAETWKEIAKIEEFDRSITEKIIGFELICLDAPTAVEEIVSVVINGKTYKLVEE